MKPEKPATSTGFCAFVLFIFTVASQAFADTREELESTQQALANQRAHGDFLQRKLDALEQALSNYRQRLEKQRQELLELRESHRQLREQHDSLQASSAVTDTLAPLRSQLESEAIPGITLILLDNNGINIQIASDRLFEVGRSSVSPDGRALLRQIANVLQAYNHNIQLRIVGHSDNTPLGAKLARIFTDNWGLSLARAISAARFLGLETNLTAHAISVAGMGDQQPIGDNASAAGRRQNRRIEIFLEPRVQP